MLSLSGIIKLHFSRDKTTVNKIITVHFSDEWLEITVAPNIFFPSQEAKVPKASIKPSKLNVLKLNWVHYGSKGKEKKIISQWNQIRIISIKPFNHSLIPKWLGFGRKDAKLRTHTNTHTHQRWIKWHQSINPNRGAISKHPNSNRARQFLKHDAKHNKSVQR